MKFELRFDGLGSGENLLNIMVVNPYDPLKPNLCCEQRKKHHGNGTSEFVMECVRLDGGNVYYLGEKDGGIIFEM